MAEKNEKKYVICVKRDDFLKMINSVVFNTNVEEIIIRGKYVEILCVDPHDDYKVISQITHIFADNDMYCSIKLSTK